MTSLEKLTQLARVTLTTDEQEQFPQQLQTIMEYMDVLRSVDLPFDAPEMAHTGCEMNAWREDRVIPFEDTSVLVSLFPEVIAEMNAVPSVFDRE